MKFKLSSNVIAAAFPMLLSLTFVVLAAALPECAFAAGTDQDFQSLYDMLKGGLRPQGGNRDFQRPFYRTHR